MQGRLVDHRAAQERVTIVVQRNGHTVEPVCPTSIQLSLEADFVIRHIRGRLGHLLVPHPFLSLFIWLKDTVPYGDDASSHDVIDVVIDDRKHKRPRCAMLAPLPGIPDRDPIEHQAG